MLKDWKAGIEPKKGPQNGRINSLGIQGRTSLFEIPHNPIDRDWAAEKEKYAAMKAEQAAKAAAAKAAAAAAAPAKK